MLDLFRLPLRLQFPDASVTRVQGELRCDVNVSVRRATPGAPNGTRCEVKNLNGVRFLMAAIGTSRSAAWFQSSLHVADPYPVCSESEVNRQIGELEAGREVIQATRGFNAVTSETFHLRSKEDAPDYRYMPDPELGPILVSEVSNTFFVSLRTLDLTSSSTGPSRVSPGLAPRTTRRDVRSDPSSVRTLDSGRGDPRRYG